MLKHLESMDGWLMSIGRSMEIIAQAVVKLDERGVFDHLAATCGCSERENVPQQDSAPATGAPSRFVVPEGDVDPNEWISRKEAWIYMGVVKSTLEEMIRSGELPSYHRKGDEKKKKPRVWLNKADVDRMYKSYTLRKGKEKKI